MAAEVVRAALDEVVRFVVCPHLTDELRTVLYRDRFRRYVTTEAADVYADSVEAASEPADDPTDVPRVSPDPDDDYLVALARTVGADAIISGDADLDVKGGPVRLTPRDVLEQLRLGSQERLMLNIALWNLHVRIQQAVSQRRDPQLTHFLEHVQTAAQKLGGDPDSPLFGTLDIGETTTDIRELGRSERTACAYALKLDLATTGQLHAEYLDRDRLPLAFEILDRQDALARLLELQD